MKNKFTNALTVVTLAVFMLAGCTDYGTGGVPLQTAFPPFSEQGIDGKTISIASCKGKVVLVDFWATWCPPCVAEVPNVVSAYKKYHDKGFEVIGISADQDKTRLATFIKSHDMTWPQYCDGDGWNSKLYQMYGLHQIPTTYLLDTNGIIIARDLRGDDLGVAVAKALQTQ